MLPTVQFQPITSGCGYSSANCGLSLLSAYANGTGICMALALRIIAVVSVNEGHARPESAPSPVLDDYLGVCALRACDLAGRRLPAHIRAEITSSVPPGKGLKTSAAVSSAFVSSLYSAMGITWQPTHLVQATTEAAKLARKAQAMSLDDAWASVSGGIVITDEKRLDVIERRSSPEGVEVVIFIPDILGPPVHRLDRRKLMASHKPSFDALLSRIINSGEIYEPMTDAAFITARAFGYSEEPLSLALTRGALGVSLSGKGPAVGAICRRGEAKPIMSAWRQLAGRIICTRPDDSGLSVRKLGALRFIAEREVA